MANTTHPAQDNMAPVLVLLALTVVLAFVGIVTLVSFDGDWTALGEKLLMAGIAGIGLIFIATLVMIVKDVRQGKI